MTDQIRQIALRIKELREISGVTIAEMAALLGVDDAVYQGYEGEKADIPISALYGIAQRLDVDLNELLTGDTPRLSDFCVVRAGQGADIDRYPGYSFHSLAYKFLHRMMEPLLVSVEPDEKQPKLVSHPGQEFNYVLEGKIEFIFDKKSVVLGPGDSVYFNPAHPHGQRACSDKPAKFLTVIAQ